MCKQLAFNGYVSSQSFVHLNVYVPEKEEQCILVCMCVSLCTCESVQPKILCMYVCVYIKFLWINTYEEIQKQLFLRTKGNSCFWRMRKEMFVV